MKTTQAWGWLAAGVLAAGLNATYHDGGLEWLHRIADRVQNSAAVLGLASGGAEQFVAEARLLTTRHNSGSCRLATALAGVGNRVAESEAGYADFDVMTVRQEAALARLEANQALMDAELTAQAEHFRAAATALRIPDFNTPRVTACPRMRLNLPRMPMINIPAHVVQVNSPGPV